VIVDDTVPVGRVVVVLDEASRAWLAWLGGDTEPGRIRLQQFGPDGGVTEPVEITRVDAGRSSGFPVLGLVPEGLLLAWTHPEDGVRATLFSPGG
jgi:hypothetical protein